MNIQHGSGAHAQLLNQAQPSTGLSSARLGGSRLPSDGTEQVLLAPRKDAAALLHTAEGARSG